MRRAGHPVNRAKIKRQVKYRIGHHRNSIWKRLGAKHHCEV